GAQAGGLCRCAHVLRLVERMVARRQAADRKRAAAGQVPQKACAGTGGLSPVRCCSGHGPLRTLSFFFAFPSLSPRNTMSTDLLEPSAPVTTVHTHLRPIDRDGLMAFADKGRNN